MKIALVHLRHAYSGGVELYLNNMARYMAEKGEDVTIICRSHDAKPPHPKVKFVKLKGISLGKTHRLWKFAKSVEKHIASSDYDLVYGLAHAWTHDVLRIGAGTSVHLSRSLNRPMRFKDRINNIIESKAMAPGAYQHVICNSYKSAAEIKEAHGVPDDKITVLHNFVDTSRFDATRLAEPASKLKQELGVDDGKPVYLFLGTGYERKGLKQALEAYSKLPFEAHFLVVGRETHQSQYESYAKQLGVSSLCQFIGEDKRPELFFTLADCYVLPTLYEPFGFTVIESLACGTPTITTQNCGASEVLTPSVSTTIGAKVSPDELLEAMVAWKDKKTPALSEQCRALAQSLDVDIMLEKNYQKLLEVYEQKGVPMPSFEHWPVVSSGSERTCYRDPSNADRCIKVSRKSQAKQTLRELKYYQYLERKGVPYTHIPKFYNKVEQDEYIGLEMEFICNFDGSVAPNLEAYVLNTLTKDKVESFYQTLEEVKNYLIRYNVIPCDLVLSNFLVMTTNSSEIKVYLIDGLGGAELMPISNYLPILGKRKIERKWDKFIKDRVSPLTERL